MSLTLFYQDSVIISNPSQYDIEKEKLNNFKIYDTDTCIQLGKHKTELLYNNMFGETLGNFIDDKIDVHSPFMLFNDYVLIHFDGKNEKVYHSIESVSTWFDIHYLQALEHISIFTYKSSCKKYNRVVNLEKIYNYFIYDTLSTHVKIGKSKNVEQRLKKLQTANSSKLILLCKTFKFTEKELHDKFKHLHVNGEWFQFTQEISDFISIL